MTMRSIHLHLLIASIVAWALSGCFWATTKSEGQAIKKDVKTLQDQIGTKTQSMDAEIAKLQKTLDDAAKLLKRNSADLGADMDSLRKEVQKLCDDFPKAHSRRVLATEEICDPSLRNITRRKTPETHQECRRAQEPKDNLQRCVADFGAEKRIVLPEHSIKNRCYLTGRRSIAVKAVRDSAQL